MTRGEIMKKIWLYGIVVMVVLSMQGCIFDEDDPKPSDRGTL